MNKQELRELAEAYIAAHKLPNVTKQDTYKFLEIRQAFIETANPAAIIALLDRLEAAERVCEVKIIKRTTRDNPKEYECPYCQQHFVVYDKNTQMDLPYCGSCGRAILDAADNYCGVCGVKLKWQEAK